MKNRDKMYLIDIKIIIFKNVNQKKRQFYISGLRNISYNKKSFSKFFCRQHTFLLCLETYFNINKTFFLDPSVSFIVLK